MARLALQRLASLPLVWHPDDSLDWFQQQLAGEGLRAVSGGRLLHIAPPFDKGEALDQVLAWLGGGAASLRLLACGDSENDRSLLERADLALVFHPAAGTPLTLAPRRRLAEAELSAPPQAGQRLERQVIAGGPRPWLEAVLAALADVGALAGDLSR
jgi:D-glycerate 3-kinase